MPGDAVSLQIQLPLKPGESVTISRGLIAASDFTVSYSDARAMQAGRGHTLLGAKSDTVYSSENPSEVVQALIDKTREQAG